MHELEEFSDWATLHEQIAEVARGRPSVVVVSAGWCQPCKTLKASIMDERKLSDDEFNRAVWFVMDIDRNSKELQEELGVRSVPRVMYLDQSGGVEVLGNNPLSTLKQRLKSLS